MRFRTLLLLGLLLRLPFLPVIGFEQDFIFFSSWAKYMANEGLLSIYDHPEAFEHRLINYPPVYLYVLYLLAKVFRLFFSAPFESRLFLCLIKSATVLFEAVAAWGLYHWLAKRRGESAGLWAMALYYLNPAVIYVSVYYGQVDAIFAALLLFSLLWLLDGRFFYGGAALAAALLMKIQALPFLPLFFLVPLLRKGGKAAFIALAGFVLAALLILSPFIAAGKLPTLWLRCVTENFQWGQSVTIGAFNLWRLHSDPNILPERIWGWLFGSDGELSANALVVYLTYKNLGTALFGAAFLVSLYAIVKRSSEEGILAAVSFAALAFYMLPVKVHERYLFPFFIFYALLAAASRSRRCFYAALTFTFLMNLITICPLIGEIRQASEIDASQGIWIAAANVILFVLFIAYEWILPASPHRRFSIMANALLFAMLLSAFLLWARNRGREEDPRILYLSHIKPVFSQQDWPAVPPELAADPPPGYGVGIDLSTDGNQLRIGDRIYRYGLGAHAKSRIEYDVPGEYDVFQCWTGVDAEALMLYDEYPGWGTVSFSVLVNGEMKYEGPLTIPYSHPCFVLVHLPKKEEGTNRLTLIVDNAENDTKGDHADWALACVLRAERP
ncbi:MAG: NPCBM/NEW2 domain-containing protein [Candidatus Omnitrophota bacterium]